MKRVFVYMIAALALVACSSEPEPPPVEKASDKPRAETSAPSGESAGGPKNAESKKIFPKEILQVVESTWVYQEMRLIKNGEAKASTKENAGPHQEWRWDLDNGTLEVTFRDRDDPEKSCFQTAVLPIQIKQPKSGGFEIDFSEIDRPVRIECHRKGDDGVFTAFFEFPNVKFVYRFEKVGETEAHLVILGPQDLMFQHKVKSLELLFSKASI